MSLDEDVEGTDKGMTPRNLGWDIWADPPEVQRVIWEKVTGSYEHALVRVRERMPLQMNAELRHRLQTRYQEILRGPRPRTRGPILYVHGQKDLEIRKLPEVVLQLPSLQTERVREAIRAREYLDQARETYER